MQDRLELTSAAATFRHRLPTARKVWLNVHLYLGLTAGLVLSLIGLTGSLLVLGVPIMEMEVGSRAFDAAGPIPARAAVDDWIASARRSYADVTSVDFVVGPGFGYGGGNAANVFVQNANGQRSTVTVDPNTGRALGRLRFEETFAFWIIRIHTQLSSSLSWGRDAVAWLGLVMILSMLTGLYLWWPRNHNWRAALTPKLGAAGRRRLLDLHNVFAVWLYVPLFVLVFTGVYIIKPQWLDPAIALVSVPRTPDTAALARASKPGACAAPITPGQAADLAQAKFPNSKFVLMVTPEQSQEPFRVQLAPPNNIEVKGSTIVLIDRECPVILTAIDGEWRNFSESFRSASFVLHKDLMLGRVGSAIVFLAGLLMPLSFATGVMLWLGKRRNRRRAA